MPHPSAMRDPEGQGLRSREPCELVGLPRLVPSSGVALGPRPEARISLDSGEGLVRTVSAEQVTAASVPLRTVYDLVFDGLVLHGRGEYEMPTKQGVHSRAGAFMHAMPAYLPTRDLLGAKLVSVYPGNSDRDLPTTTGVIVMMDPDTGVATHLVDAAWITNIRTAMVSMADVQLLALPNPSFGIVGATGACGRAHLEAIAEVFPGSCVRVGTRSPERCMQLMREYVALPLQITMCTDLESLVRECDVLIISTSHLPEPILKPEWLHPGHNLINVHTRAWPTNVAARLDLVSCDDRHQLLDPSTGFTARYPDITPHLELSDVVLARHPGRESDTQIVFSVNYGLAIFDLLVAEAVLQRL